MKPCPFCGSESIHVEEQEELYLVMCANCYAAGPAVDSRTGGTKRGAAMLWDTRPIDGSVEDFCD